MARDDLFKANASLIYDLACAIGAYSRFALVAIVTNPVNSMVPIMSEVLMRVRSKLRLCSTFICLMFI